VFTAQIPIIPNGAQVAFRNLQLGSSATLRYYAMRRLNGFGEPARPRTFEGKWQTGK